MNTDHLAKLREGVSAWNEWRRQHPSLRPDLTQAALASVVCNPSLLHRAAGPSRRPSLFQVFRTWSLEGVDLSRTALKETHLREVRLTGADLRGADLGGTQFRQVDLQKADLRGADLRGSHLMTCDLSGTRLDGAILGETHFGYVSLAGCSGLENVKHASKSYLDQFTLAHSVPLPSHFLNGASVSPDLQGLVKALSRGPRYLHPFISYSRRDESFVTLLRQRLTLAGAASWFAPEDLRGEQDLERDLFTFVDGADAFLLALSPNSVGSDWVDKEVRRGLGQSLRGQLMFIVVVLADVGFAWGASGFVETFGCG